jgi:hypothetical protein
VTSWLQDCLRYSSIFDTSLGDGSSVLPPYLETGQDIITLVAHWSIIIFFDVSRSRLGIRSVVTLVSPYSVDVPTQCRFRSTSINRLAVTFLLRSEMIVLNAIFFFFLPDLSTILYRFLGNIVLFWKIYYGTTHPTLVFPHRRTMSVQSISILITVQYVLFTRSVVIKLICLCHNIHDNSLSRHKCWCFCVLLMFLCRWSACDRENSKSWIARKRKFIACI